METLSVFILGAVVGAASSFYGLWLVTRNFGQVEADAPATRKQWNKKPKNKPKSIGEAELVKREREAPPADPVQ